jgi:hypothetical protein
MKLNKTLLLVATFALCGQLLAEVPKVENIRASQLDGTKFVEILYDVEDAENDKLTIRVEISADGGERYNVPARTFQGAVGANIDPGKDKKITWNAGLDWDGEFSDKMRVRITASDGKGLPGLEWSKEIPPGGFLMGQDGGPEGSGPSIHINVNYSFWLSKSWITVGQYVEFLNLLTASDKVDSLGKSTQRKFSNIILAGYPENREISLLNLGQTRQIRWNVNKFEANKTDMINDPAIVLNYGAAAFANFYGLDVPLEIEWEKAMRGPDHDDAGEHQTYAWGNSEKPKFSKYINKFGVSCYLSDLKVRPSNYHPNYIYEITSSPWNINNFTTVDQMYKEMTTLDHIESSVFNSSSNANRSPFNPIYRRYSVDPNGIFRVIRRSKD